MFQHASTSPRRALVRGGFVAAAAFAAAFSVPGVASAHVSVQPDTAEGGGFSVVAFRVPNERDDASTTRMQVILPQDHPIGSVQTTPVPGWSVKTSTRKLDKPIDMFGEKLDSVVSRVTWTATGRGIAPGQFQDFSLSLGPLPESGQLKFKALQAYSTGEQVAWNEVSADKSVEPEHPAPILTVIPEGAAGQSTTAEKSSADASAPAAAATADSAAGSNNDGSSSGLPIALSGAALVVSLLAALLAWRRGRPAHPAEAPAQRKLEDTQV
jgi:uncharacterized protein